MLMTQAVCQFFRVMDMGVTLVWQKRSYEFGVVVGVEVGTD
jgi:hypothetical protein